MAKYIKKNLENMHRSCLEGGVVSFACLPATENISWSFAAPKKTVKTIRQRLWPNAGVTEGLAARGLFAARLCVYKTQHRKHIRSVANCKRQMTSSLVQCAGCRCLDRRPVSRTSLPKRRPTLRSRFHVCFLRLHGHLRACLSSERLPLHASTLPKCTSR